MRPACSGGAVSPLPPLPHILIRWLHQVDRQVGGAHAPGRRQGGVGRQVGGELQGRARHQAGGLLSCCLLFAWRREAESKGEGGEGSWQGWPWNQAGEDQVGIEGQALGNPFATVGAARQPNVEERETPPATGSRCVLCCCRARRGACPPPASGTTGGGARTTWVTAMCRSLATAPRVGGAAGPGVTGVTACEHWRVVKKFGSSSGFHGVMLCTP